MNVQFTGKIIAAEALQQGTTQQGQPWASQNYIIEELNQQYPGRAVFQVYGSEKIQQFQIQVGEVLTAHIGLRARQSSKDGRWFNQLDCWKVDRFGASQPQPQGYVPMQGQGFASQPQGQVVQSQVGMQQGQYPQVAPIQQQIQAYCPELGAQGQAAGQQVATGGGQPQKLPF